jgi:hypothetical protein
MVPMLSVCRQMSRQDYTINALPLDPPAVDAPRREWFEWFRDAVGVSKDPPALLTPESSKDIWFHYMKDE